MNEGNYPQPGAGSVDELVSNRVTDGCVRTPPPQDRPQLAQGCSEAPAAPTPSKPRSISIEPKDHGFIVTVGCQSFAIEKISTLIRNLEKYLEHPVATEQKWLSGKLEL
jgi:hypothetical protein